MRTAKKGTTTNLVRLFWAAKSRAEQCGLYLLVVNEGSNPHWTLYDRATGKALVTYLPASRYWSTGKKHGKAKGWMDVIDMAVKLRNCGSNT